MSEWRDGNQTLFVLLVGSIGEEYDLKLEEGQKGADRRVYDSGKRACHGESVDY